MIQNEYLSETYRGYNINWFYDECPQNPRTEWDNLAHMICWHRRYSLGDKHAFPGLEYFLSSLVTEHITHEKLKEYLLSKKGRVWLEYIEHTPEEIEQYECNARVALGYGDNYDGDYWECDGPHEKDNMIDQAVDQAPIENLTIDDVCELLEDELVMLPISLYDHSGLSIWLGSPNCMWDSGYVGLMYLTKEDALKELGNCTEENWRECATQCMEAEMKVYNYYISGEVYGFCIEDENGDEVDSCWGFYGSKAVVDQMIQNRICVDEIIERRERMEKIYEAFSCE